jgi:hypothetical protein
MNEACSSMTIVAPPAFDVSLGLTNTHIFKVDFNYITKDEIVYGGSVGIRPFKMVTKIPDLLTVNGFLGYNLAGCIIFGFTGGFVRTTNYALIDDKNKTSRGSFKPTYGMSLKLITSYTPIPISLGGYASNTGIGITIGTIF